MLVKENQPDLFHELQDWFDHPQVWRNLDSRTARSVSKGHARLERRAILVSAACGWLDWPDLEQVMCFDKSVICLATGEVKTSCHYAITSLPKSLASAEALLRLRRQHWAIENQLHYPRDVIFHEDASRLRSGSAPVLMASIRNLLLNVLRVFGHSSLKRARERFVARPLHALTLLELPVDFWLE